MHITLISPKGPLYRRLAALVLDELDATTLTIFRNFFPINSLLRVDTNRRDGFPLGDEAWTGSLLRVH
jgi:hypothetical protein